MYVCITESLFCTLETNRTLQIKETSIKKKADSRGSLPRIKYQLLLYHIRDLE